MMIEMPGSKSILQRLLVLLAHARGDIRIRNYNPCQDVLELERALKVYGFEVQRSGNEASFRFCEQLHQQSGHEYRFAASATAYRLWLSVLANLPGISSRVHASEILFNRGIAPLCEALNSLGAEIRMQGTSLELIGTALKGGEVSIRTALSSQYASSLLLAAPFMQESLSLRPDAVKVSAPYLKLSADMLRSFGARVDLNEGCIVAHGAGFCLPAEFEVDSDLSTAAFYAVKAALGKQVQALKLTLHPDYEQPDMAIWDILLDMGVRIESEGTIYRIHPSRLKGIELDLKDNPDLMPVLSIAALFATSSSRWNGIGRLIHKESNRVLGICQALEILGVKHAVDEDSLRVWPLGSVPPVCTLDTQQDHRLVMAFSLLAEHYPQVKLSERESLRKSLPCLES
jgi:3-phosphoshikimate 1-carboxyvinyltransferase